MSLFDLKRGLLRSNQAKVKLPCVRIVSSPHHWCPCGKSVKDPEAAMGRLRQSGYPPTSQGMSRMPARHYQCKNSSWNLLSKHGLADTLFQLVASKTVRIFLSF